ncbi:MAG: hypothetical protein HY930_03255 [Euryarchaeota archaeon]|nr:hypothetical protein [Euryarchaeota archaeon]
MLLKLCDFLGIAYLPVDERESLERKFTFPQRLVDKIPIWDILGEYDAINKKVSIYGNAIESFTEALYQQKVLDDIFQKYSKDFVTLIIHELVRLHEHAHALAHCGKLVFGGAENCEEWKEFLNAPKELKEPIAEFIVYAAIKENKFEDMEKIFLEADKFTPAFYQRWKELEKKIAEKWIEIGKRHIAPILGVIRGEKIDSFDKLLSEVTYDKLQPMLVESILYQFAEKRPPSSFFQI